MVVGTHKLENEGKGILKCFNRIQELNTSFTNELHSYYKNTQSNHENF